LHRWRNVLDVNSYFNHRTRGNHRARVNASYGTYDYDDGISDVTYAKALKKGNEVLDYVMDFERHGTGRHYDAWTQTSMDDETIRSYVDEIQRLRKVVDEMGEHRHKLRERVQMLRVAHGEIGAVLLHLYTARTSFNDLVKYAHDHGVDLPREGGGEVVEDGFWFRVGPDEDAPIAQRLQKRLSVVKAEARNGAPADPNFVSVDMAFDDPFTQNTQESFFNLTPAVQTGGFADDVDTVQDVLDHKEDKLSQERHKNQGIASPADSDFVPTQDSNLSEFTFGSDDDVVIVKDGKRKRAVDVDDDDDDDDEDDFIELGGKRAGVKNKVP
jgi:hypothetical protein